MKDLSNVDVYYGGCDENGVRQICGSVTSCNIIGFMAGTTGYRGGDSGHGGRTSFTIFDESSSDIQAVTCRDGRALRVELGGDCELETIIKALKSIVMILEAGASKGTEFTDVKRIRELMNGDIEESFEQRKVKALENIAACLKPLVSAKD